MENAIFAVMTHWVRRGAYLFLDLRCPGCSFDFAAIFYESGLR